MTLRRGSWLLVVVGCTWLFGGNGCSSGTKASSLDAANPADAPMSAGGTASGGVLGKGGGSAGSPGKGGGGALSGGAGGGGGTTATGGTSGSGGATSLGGGTGSGGTTSTGGAAGLGGTMSTGGASGHSGATDGSDGDSPGATGTGGSSGVDGAMTGACNGQTCGDGQYCRAGCCGTVGCVQPPSTCQPLPSACNGTPTCQCVCGMSGPPCTINGDLVQCGCA